LVGSGVGVGVPVSVGSSCATLVGVAVGSGVFVDVGTSGNSVSSGRGVLVGVDVTLLLVFEVKQLEM